jgi:hypothetical protein
MAGGGANLVGQSMRVLSFQSPSFALVMIFAAMGLAGAPGCGGGAAPPAGDGGVAGMGGSPIDGGGGTTATAGSGGMAATAGSGGMAVPDGGAGAVAQAGASGAAASDWVEVPNLAQGAETYAGITTAVTSPESGGIVITFPYARNGTYFIYVRGQAAMHTFGRAWGMVTTGTVPAFVGGLVPGQTYCLTVRTVVAGIEDGNTAEKCAVAAPTPPPPVPVLSNSSPSPQYPTGSFGISGTAVAGVGLRYDLERSIDGGAFAVVASKAHVVMFAPPLPGALTFQDLVELPGAYEYRVRAFADGVATGVSSPMSFKFVANPWKKAFDPFPDTPVVSPIPRLLVDKAGKLVIQEAVSAGPATGAPETPRVGVVRRGPDLTGDPDLWKRLMCGQSDVAFYPYGASAWKSFAKAADGTVYVLEDAVVPGPEASRLNRLFKIGATGCAQTVHTAIHGGVFNIVAHPTDPLKLAVAGARGVWVSADGGATFRLFKDRATGGGPTTIAYAADGTLYLAHAKSLARSSDYVAYTNYASWPAPTDAPFEMAINAAGKQAVITSSPVTTEHGAYVGAAGGALTFEPNGFQGTQARDGVTWLADGRLLMLMNDSGPSGLRDFRRLAVRSAAGVWSSVELPGRYFGVAPGPVLLDPRTGHENDIYWTYLRSRDRGLTWEALPSSAQAVAATVVGPDLALSLLRPDGINAPVGFRSLDGGVTQTAAVALPSDGRVWFNPAAPLLGVSALGSFTVDGGATWAPSTGGAVWTQVGFANAGFAVGARPTTVATLVSHDSGATWTADTVRRGFACGNGTMGIAGFSNTSGQTGTVSFTNAGFGVALTGPAFTTVIACGLSVDGQIVYMSTAGGLYKSTTGVVGPFTSIIPAGLGGLFTVSANGQRLVSGPKWSDTGGE